MSRLPVRVRLAAGFAVAMALVVAAVGAVVHVRLASSLLDEAEDRLLSRSAALEVLVRARGGDVSGDELRPQDEDGFAQVLGPGGAVLAASAPLARVALVSLAERAAATDGTVLVRRNELAGLGGEPALLAVTRVEPGDPAPLTLVVGASLEEREEALDGLQGQLLAIAPAAFLVAGGIGYLVAGRALRPVEAMRSRAAELSTERLDERLPLPQAHDELHRLGSTLNAMLDRLAAGIERERRLVADASHELRTPLALLRAELELGLRRPRSPDEQRAALASALEEVDRLTVLAESLLVLAQDDEHGLPLALADLDVGEALHAVAGRFVGAASLDGRPLGVLPTDGLSVTADRLRLEQALGALVENALRHGRGGVTLSAGERGGLVELRVSDEGDGLPPGLVGTAFDRFARGDGARASAGAGLGLSLVAAIARAHGGSASVERRADGKGAVATIVLPRGEGGRTGPEPG